MAEENSIAIEVLPTGAALGADVRGIDLSSDLDAAIFRQIYKAWNDHLVLRFRDQWLDDAALVTFSRSLESSTWRQRLPWVSLAYR